MDKAERIESIIADYILDNPELVYRALQVLQDAIVTSPFSKPRP